jgi:hypothetical protein
VGLEDSPDRVGPARRIRTELLSRALTEKFAEKVGQAGHPGINAGFIPPDHA